MACCKYKKRFVRSYYPYYIQVIPKIPAKADCLKCNIITMDVYLSSEQSQTGTGSGEMLMKPETINLRWRKLCMIKLFFYLSVTLP